MVGVQIGPKRVVETFVPLAILIALMLQSSQAVDASPANHGIKLDAIGFLASLASQLQNVTYEGDLVVSGNKTFTIENSNFYMNGTITVKDNSALIIRSSRFTAVANWEGDGIVLMNHAILIVENATIIFTNPHGFGCRITIRDDAKANITRSTTRGRGYVVAYENSFIYVNNSTMTVGPGITTYEGSSVATFDTSTAEIENSTMDGWFVWGNSTISIKNSIAGMLRTTWRETDKTTINITNSKILQIETAGGKPTFNIEGSTVSHVSISGGNASFTRSSVAEIGASWYGSVWFASSSVGDVSAYGNARIWLIDSSYGGIKTVESATVIVGWHLPLFGLVTMPYKWVQFLQVFGTITIATLSIASLIILYRRWMRRRSERLEKLEESTNPARAHHVVEVNCNRVYS